MSQFFESLILRVTHSSSLITHTSGGKGIHSITVVYIHHSSRISHQVSS